MGVQISGDTGNVLATKGTYTGNLTVGGVLTYEDVTNVDSVGLVTARSGIEIGARPGVAASISVDGNMIVSGITTFTPGGSEIVRINSGGLLVYNDVSFFGDSTNAYWDKSANQFLLNDNTKLSLGSSSDLQIYHSGTFNRNYIQTTGTNHDLTIAADEVALTNSAASETLGKFIADGAVELYYDNSKRFETQSAGVEITGKLTFATEGLAGGSIDLGIDADLNLYHDNSDAYFDNNTGDFYIRNAGSNPNQIYISGKGGENGIVVNGDAGVQLYNDNTMRFETNSSGAIVYGNNANIFQATCATNSTASVVFQNTENNTSGDMRLLIKTAANQGSDPYIKFDAGGSDMIVGTHYLGTTNNELRLGAGTYVHTVNGIQINGNGNVFMNALNSGSGASDMRYNTSSKQVFYDSSSRLVKTDIEDLSYGLDAIKQLKPRIYKRTDTDGDIEIGFIADEVINIIPEIVPTAEKSLFTKNEEDTEIVPSYVEYKRLTSVLTKAVQELSAKVETLEAEIAALKSN